MTIEQRVENLVAKSKECWLCRDWVMADSEKPLPHIHNQIKFLLRQLWYSLIVAQFETEKDKAKAREYIINKYGSK
jgi:hypothetical protein